LSKNFGVKLRINLQLTGKISLKLDSNLGLLLEYGRVILILRVYLFACNMLTVHTTDLFRSELLDKLYENSHTSVL